MLVLRWNEEDLARRLERPPTWLTAFVTGGSAAPALTWIDAWDLILILGDDPATVFARLINRRTPSPPKHSSAHRAGRARSEAWI